MFFKPSLTYQTDGEGCGHVNDDIDEQAQEYPRVAKQSWVNLARIRLFTGIVHGKNFFPRGGRKF